MRKPQSSSKILLHKHFDGMIINSLIHTCLCVKVKSHLEVVLFNDLETLFIISSFLHCPYVLLWYTKIKLNLGFSNLHIFLTWLANLQAFKQTWVTIATKRERKLNEALRFFFSFKTPSNFSLLFQKCFNLNKTFVMFVRTI